MGISAHHRQILADYRKKAATGKTTSVKAKKKTQAAATGRPINNVKGENDDSKAIKAKTSRPFWTARLPRARLLV